MTLDDIKYSIVLNLILHTHTHWLNELVLSIVFFLSFESSSSISLIWGRKDQGLPYTFLWNKVFAEIHVID